MSRAVSLRSSLVMSRMSGAFSSGVFFSSPSEIETPDGPRSAGFWFGSSGVSGRRLEEQSHQRSEESLPPPPHVVHELEEPQVQRQLLLRDPPVGTQPAP